MPAASVAFGEPIRTLLWLETIVVYRCRSIRLMPQKAHLLIQSLHGVSTWSLLGVQMESIWSP
jgi:hypothetical protein